MSSLEIEVHFSAAVIAVNMKPCTVIVLDALFKKHHDLVPLTYLSCSTDFVKIYVKSRNKVHFSVAVKAVSKEIVLDTLFKNAP